MKFQKLWILKSLSVAIAIALFQSNAAAQTVDYGSSTFPEPRRVTSFAEQKPHIAARMGVTNPEGDYDGAFEYGVEIGFQPYIPFGFGIELSTFASDRDDSSDLDRTKLLAKATYNFGGQIFLLKDSYFGVGLGPVFDTVSNTTRTRLGTDLLAGFDIPLTATDAFRSDSFSIGVNANYLLVSSGAPDSVGLIGLLKYWY